MQSSIYQLARAHESNFKNKIKFLKNGIIRIKSNTDPSKVYTIKDNACSCPGFAFNHHCSHITALRVYRRSQPKNA